MPADNPFVGRNGGIRPEIWAYGLRNPWRFWIDHQTRTMLIGDAGATAREEVDLVPLDRSGVNFGWPCFEGTLVFDATASCQDPVGPLFDFPRDNGVCVVIGGVVARDSRIRALAGRYLYGDLCAGDDHRRGARRLTRHALGRPRREGAAALELRSRRCGSRLRDVGPGRRLPPRPELISPGSRAT